MAPQYWAGRLQVLVAVVGLLSSVTALPGSSRSCSSKSIPYPTIPGAKILEMAAAEHRNETHLTAATPPLAASVTISFCEVNVTYTHPGWNDTVHVQVWLPLDGWNGRFQGTGGGGYTAGNSIYHAQPVADGYSAASTDGGHSNVNPDPGNWALAKAGQVNQALLKDFASVSLSDMTLIGQVVTKSFYGTKAKFSYWTGCSTGGRQGLYLAQRYPDLYNGILAKAPAINWDTLLVAMYWPQQVMNSLGVFPPACEFEAFRQAAVDACDGLDGLKDRIIAKEDACSFDPSTVVGKPFQCGNETRTLTAGAANVVAAIWAGATDPQGKRQWYGWTRDTDLTGLAGTSTLANGTTVAVPFVAPLQWIQYFVAKDPNLPAAQMTNQQYFAIMEQSRKEYLKIIDTSDPDLANFKAKGGKMITWHGMSDNGIPLNGTLDYYKRVQAAVPNTRDFYRVFAAPGVQHCGGGTGPQPVQDLESLVAWVERGVVPEILKTVNATVHGSPPSAGQSLPTRNICAWPKEQRYGGGDPTLASSFYCA